MIRPGRAQIENILFFVIREVEIKLEMSVGISKMSLITVRLSAYKILVNIPGISLPQSE